MTSCNINKTNKGTPKEAFDMICKTSQDMTDLYRIISTIGWSNIAAEVSIMGNRLIFPSSGLVLCGFAINYINHISAITLPRLTLEQGTDCIKHLYQINIEESTGLSDTDKATAIQWNNEFLDIWRNHMADALEQAELLIE